MPKFGLLHPYSTYNPLIDYDELEEESYDVQPPTSEGDDIDFLTAEGIKIYEHHRIILDPGQEITRVDVFLANRIKNISRSRVKNATLAGFVKVNDKVVKANYKLKPYDEVTVILPYPPAPDLKPEAIPLDVAYEDEVMLIINKPAGLVCHPGSGNYNGTLINALLYYFEQKSETLTPSGDPIRPGLVHRIDKDTTGLLAIAKTEHAYSLLSKQFYERTTDRLYYALVWGNPKHDKGTVIGSIGRHPNDRKKFAVYEDGSMGKHAVTHYEVLHRFGVCALVRCKLETGRTHQIRVHMKYIGHTLFGDVTYGGQNILRGKPSKAFQRFIQDCLNHMPRQALHAKTLGFVHPETQERVFFNSLLPPDFSNLLMRLGAFLHAPLPESLIAELTLGTPTYIHPDTSATAMITEDNIAPLASEIIL
jgi:23S rRNA pseudouridine1911/1915/1917 synthase